MRYKHNGLPLGFVLSQKVSNYLLSLIAAWDTIGKSKKQLCSGRIGFFIILEFFNEIRKLRFGIDKFTR